MLLRFVCENYLSFREEVSLDLVPSTEKQHPSHILKTGVGKVCALKGVALYGPNAAGKSNLVKAMAAAQGLIISGTRPGEGLPVVPFLLDREWSKKPTRFEFQVTASGKIFNYGFVLDRRQIHEEWLYVTSSVRELKWFLRKVDDKGQSQWDWGRQLASSSEPRQFLEFIARGTRANQLFLTEATFRNLEEVMPLYDWFKDKLQVLPADARYTHLLVRASQDEAFATFLGAVLRSADTGIDGISCVSEELDLDKHLKGFPPDMRGRIEEGLRNDKTFLIRTSDEVGILLTSQDGHISAKTLKARHKLHGSSQGTVDFDLWQESDGTRRLMHLAPALSDPDNEDRVIVVDEIDRSLHPKMSRMLVGFFMNHLRSANSQLIFTTHESHLLDQQTMRRDEIWFMEKTGEQATKLYSLAEFSIRPDLVLERGYLQGRFGAVPMADLDAPASTLREWGSRSMHDDRKVAE